MMKKSVSIPVAMVARKFYCCECGERLVRNPRTRIIKRGDPEYREHSRVGRVHMFGDVELTEYDFRCQSCDKITPFEEQCAIAQIQKYLGKHNLSQGEIAENIEQAETALKRKKEITGIIVKIISIAIAVFVIYMGLKKGEFSLEFYF